ncbi:hypothetical protein BAZSYMA_ACONTIG15875_0 [Bathymodiolus azoricus thioautotrophic gill symbiont]|uniref:Uncharacterized protein n=1 Tax=Bathymodiolus azoricus thioautotrophic gill symbiont TaxID=235205 RepID=A0A1H6LYE9_9GAMM|nr:hypothetical protein BAZSYMA_ACONTIG15875_0 [Bathymodiolus azoricus thioautotrophic gill symbiont]
MRSFSSYEPLEPISSIICSKRLPSLSNLNRAIYSQPSFSFIAGSNGVVRKNCSPFFLFFQYVQHDSHHDRLIFFAVYLIP